MDDATTGAAVEATAGSGITARLAAAGGAAFVAAVLVGNGLTEAGVEEGPLSDDALLADLARQATETGPQIGLALEMLGFALFVVFLGRLGALTSGTPAGWPGRVAVLAGTAMVGVKLATGSAAVAAVSAREQITAPAARALEAVGSAGFVLSWLPFAVFTVAAALALHARGLVGRPTTVVGSILGLLTLTAAVAAGTDVDNAFPLPFVLSLFWLATVSVRLAVRGGVRHAAAVREPLAASA